ncbi:MAG: hypothetical protein E6H80_10360 [Betaproteobacteria bacterium]|nr:MAG: hypothetical protein E6H80_10360 [Betaproteobacteria bacterium]
MGILSDLFVAEPRDAPSYESLQSSGKLPAGRFERVQFKGLTDLNFGILWAFLEGQEWDIKTHVLEEVAMGKGGETWLFQFPRPLVAKLGVLDRSGVVRAAEFWAQTEELMCDPSEIEPVVAELVRLAQIAASSTKGLFLWGSL